MSPNPIGYADINTTPYEVSLQGTEVRVMPKNFQGLFFFVPVLESHIDPSHHGWITFRAYLLDYQSLGGSERGLVLHSIVIGILALSDSAFRVVIIMTFQPASSMMWSEQKCKCKLTKRKLWYFAALQPKSFFNFFATSNP